MSILALPYKIEENPDLKGKIRKPGSPLLKGRRNRLNSIPFPDPIKYPQKNRIKPIRIIQVWTYQIPQAKNP